MSLSTAGVCAVVCSGTSADVIPQDEAAGAEHDTCCVV